VSICDTLAMQGTSNPTHVELLDAQAHCHHLVPDGSIHAFLADHRRELFPDQLFADLFPSGRGRPSIPADVIATVMVSQALEGLCPTGRSASSWPATSPGRSRPRWP
jgi:hypothetical protein